MKKNIAVVGGVYRECCRLPFRYDETWGSGGRAAATIAGLGLSAVLHTAVDKNSEVLLATLAHIFQFDVVTTSVEASKQFHYDHALSSPIILPPARNVGPGAHVCANAENALAFGMLETTLEVRASRIVYDPQNPISPEPFKVVPRTSPRVAYVLNRAEATKLTHTNNSEEAARKISDDQNAEVVVVKQGARGALIHEAGRFERVPAYATDSVWPIGSGDVFTAVFAARWAAEGMPASEAAHQASRAAALYMNNRVLPVDGGLISGSGSFPFSPLPLEERELGEQEFHVYLAGPFFSISQRWLVEEARLALRDMGFKVFSPLHDVGMGQAHDVAPKDINALRASRVVLAFVDGLDAGTIFEVGYARSLGKPVVALSESTPEEPLKMLTGTACDIVSDFVTAVYRTAWAARA